MRRAFTTALILCLIAPPLSASQVGGEAAEAIRLLRETYKAITGLQASFKQTEERPGVGISATEEGTFSLVPPDRMRWDYEGQTPHQVVVNGDLVWIYTPIRNQVLRREMTTREMTSGPVTLMGGLDALEEQFSVQSGSAGPEGSYSLDLFPLQENSPYERIGIDVSRETGLIERIRIHHRIGNITDIVFSGIRTGVDFPGGFFQWNIPPGTEIIEP